MTLLRIHIEPESHANTFDKYRDPPVPQEVATVDQYSPPSSCRAIVFSKYGRTFCTASTETLQALSPAEIEDVRWYFEQFLSKDSWATARAELVRRKLQQHARNLIRDFFPSEVRPENLGSVELLIEIHDARHNRSTNPNDVLHQFYWEILEDPTLWGGIPVYSPKVVCVVRVHLPGIKHIPLPVTNATTGEPTTRLKHILALTARPSHVRDIPHRLITRAISRAVRTIDRQHGVGSTLEIVRPGTFATLRKRLQARPFGYYRVVHLDLHGDVDATGAKVVFVKYDEYLRPQPDPIAAEDVSALLAQHGINTVVINACRSAAASSESSNIASLLVKSGVDVAVGMSFNVLSTTAAHFTQKFYETFLGTESSAIIAAHRARERLRIRQQPRGVPEMSSKLEDQIVPISHYSRAGMDELPQLSFQTSVDSSTEHIGEEDESLFGRERTILEFESFFSQQAGLKIHLRGQPGIGKSAILAHASAWWVETGLFTHTVQLQLHEDSFADMSVDTLLALLGSRLNLKRGAPTREAIIPALDQRHVLLVLDGMDSITWSQERSLQEQQTDFKNFLRSLKRCSVIVASRHTDSWLCKGVCQVSMELGPLDHLTSVAYAMSLLKQQSTTELTQGDKDYFDQVVDLARGNPLAIQILMLNLVHHQSKSPEADVASYLISLLALEPLQVNLHTSFSGDSGARAAIELTDLFQSAQEGLRSSKWSQDTAVNSIGLNNGTYPTARKLDARGNCASGSTTKEHEEWVRSLLLLSLAAFWHNVPTKYEPFTSVLVALAIARVELSTQDFIRRRITMRNVVSDAKEASGPLYEAAGMIRIMANVMHSESEVKNDWTSFAVRSVEALDMLLKEELRDYSELVAPPDLANHKCHYFRSFHVISPLITLASLTSANRWGDYLQLKNDLDVARMALYDHQLQHWMDNNALLPDSPGRILARREIDFDFINHLAFIVSCQSLPIWAEGGDVQNQWLLTDLTSLEPWRPAVVLQVMARFLNFAMHSIEETRQRFSLPGSSQYDFALLKKNLDLWDTTCLLELACTWVLVRAFALCIHYLRSSQPYRKMWRILVNNPMVISSDRVPDAIKNAIRVSHEQNSKLLTIQQGSSGIGALETLPAMLSQVQEAEKEIARELYPKLVPPPSTSSTASPQAYSSLRVAQEQGRMLLGLQDSTIVRTSAAVWPVLTDRSTETINLALAEVESLLIEEIATSNSVRARLHIHSELAALHGAVGNSAAALHHRRIKQSLESMFDHEAVTEQQKISRELAVYKSRHTKASAVQQTTVKQLEKQLEEQSETLRQLQEDSTVERMAVITAMEKMASTLSSLGRYTEAVDHYTRIVKERRLVLPLNEEGTILIMAKLARNYSKSGQYVQSIRQARIVRAAYAEMPNKRREYLNATYDLGAYLHDYVNSKGIWLESGVGRKYMDEAEALLKESANNDGEIAGLSERNVSGSMQMLAWLCSLQDRHEEAEGWIKQAVDLKNDYDLRLLNVMALVWGNMGKVADAMILLEWVLERRVEQDGHLHPDTVSVFANLVWRCGTSSEKAKGQAVMETFVTGFYESLDETVKRQRGAGEEIIDVAQNKFNLAMALKRANCFEESIRVFKEIVAGWDGDLSRAAMVEHAHAQISHCYGLQDNPNLERSLEHRSRAVSICMELYGPQHRETLSQEASQSVCLAGLGRYEQAICIGRSIVTRWIALEGPEHQETLIAKYDLGSFFDMQRDWTASREALKDLVVTMLELAPTWERTARAARILGRAHYRLGEFSAAAKAFEAAAGVELHSNKKVNNLQARVDLNDTIDCLKEAGDFIEARRVLVKAREVWGEEELGKAHCSLLEATFLRLEGSIDSSENLVRSVFEEWPPAPITEDFIRTRCLAQLAKLYEDRKDYRRAVELWRDSIEETRHVKADSKPSYLIYLAGLAETFIAAGRYEEAKATLRELIRNAAALKNPRQRADFQAKGRKLLSQVYEKVGVSINGR